MKTIIVYLFILFPIVLFAQNQNLHLTDENFEVLFNNKSCAWDTKLDKSPLWETAKGQRYLVDKLNNETSDKFTKILSIVYLGKSNDESIVKNILPFFESDDPKFYQSAINAFIKIESKEIVKITEEFLLDLNVEQSDKAIAIIKMLSLKTSPTSIEVLNRYQSKLNTSNNLLIKNIESARNDIQIFSKNSNESIELIRRKLFSNNLDEIRWCHTKLYYDRNKMYLPIVKSYYFSLDDSQKRKRLKILRLRERLGDVDFSRDEKSYLLNLQKMKDEQKERTLKFLSKENYHLDHKH